MVRKNYKWNISKEEGEKLINDTIQEILSNKGVMEISELNFFIQSHSRDITIKNNKKKKNLTNYIRTVFGGLRNFLEMKQQYKITQKKNQIMVDIQRDEEKNNYFLNDFLNDWVIVD